MMPAPFLSKFKPRRATLATGSAEEVKQHQDEKNHEVHEFQKCMEEVKREFPHLCGGAQQKLALERNAKKNEERLALAARGQHQSEKRFSLPDGLLRGAEDILSKLNLGKQQTSSSYAEDGVGGGTAGSSTQASQTSFAVKQSVAFSMDEQNNMLAQMDWSESSNDSLQDSLDNIERSAATDILCSSSNNNINDNNNSINVNNEKSVLVKSLERRSRRATKHNHVMRHSSRRLSGLSGISMELSDLDEEDEDEETSNESDSADNNDNADDNNDNSPPQRYHPPLKKEQSKSFSDILPDEIAVVLDNGCKEDKETDKKKKEEDGEEVVVNNPSPVTGGRRKGRLINRINRQNNYGANKPEKSSFKSMGSESSDEQVGSVLDSFARLNKKEEEVQVQQQQHHNASPGRRKGRLTNNSNKGNYDSFVSVDSANFQGDFWAWRSISSRSTHSGLGDTSS